MHILDLCSIELLH